MPLAGAYLPAAQTVLAFNPLWPHTEPGEHVTQTVAPAAGANFPTAHGVVALKPETLQNEPGGQETHTDAPVVAENVPIAHGPEQVVMVAPTVPPK